MKSLHFNNHIRSKQDSKEFADKVFKEIMQNKDRVFQITVDDGDGDVWKITVETTCECVKTVTQIQEN
jgi:hypothetical protein